MKNHTPRHPNELRRQAEERLSETQRGRKPEVDTEDTARLLHELRVHQIELEMQNEELRAAQTEIEAGRACYFDLYDLAPVGYCTLSEPGLILEANLMAATLLGTVRSALVKQPICRFIVKDDQDIYYLHRKQLFETGQAQQFELRLVQPDGAVLWAQLTATVVPVEGGAPVCRVALSDITERQQAEESLGELQRFFQSTLDGLSAHLAVLDDRGEIIFTNQAYRDFAARNGIEPGAVSKGANYLAVCDAAQGADRQAAGLFAQGIREVLSGTLPSFEMEYPCHSPDQQRWFIGRVTPLQDKVLRRVVVAHENITERKRHEARVQHLMQVRLAIRNVNQLIVHEDDPQRLIARACANLTETLGYHNAWIALLDGDGRTVVATADAGFEGQFNELRQRLARREFSACMRQALERDSAVVVHDPLVECRDCPLAGEYSGRAGFTRRLAFEGKTFGVLVVSVPAAFAHAAEEQSLFDEVADDLGFALHQIELRTRLREADDRVRVKLNALLAPEGDVGELSLADVLDVPAIQAMMDTFLSLTGIGVAIIDVRGKILVATGWQDICTKFHRVHPETCQNCLESDTELSSGVEPGAFKFYHCKNNLWEVATPIWLGNRHAGNVFFGQFFFEDETPDREAFRARARQYGFDETAYLAALDRVPRWNRERVGQIMTFFAALARQLSDLSYGNIRLARILTQRDELLARLGQNEERLRLALKATNDVVWDWDIVNDAQQWNDAGAAVFGWTDNVEALQTSAWWVDRIHPEDRLRVEQAFFAALHNPAADQWNDEYRLRKADGVYAFVVDRAHILRDATGCAVRMIGAMQDITERKRMEEALRESEMRFRFLVDHSYDLIWTLTADGVFSYVSPSWKTRLGYEPLSMVGKRFPVVVHPDDVAFCETQLSRILVSRTPLSGPEFRVRHADGSWRWHEASVTPVYAQDGSFMYFVGASRDITERKRAEEAVRESESRFRSYIEHAPYGVFVADGQGRYVDVNPGAERITGYDAAQLKSMHLADLLTEESRERGLGQFQSLAVVS